MHIVNKYVLVHAHTHTHATLIMSELHWGCGRMHTLKPRVLSGHERARTNRTPLQETALTFDAVILSRRPQSWLGLTHAGVALIHDGPQHPGADNKI